MALKLSFHLQLRCPNDDPSGFQPKPVHISLLRRTIHAPAQPVLLDCIILHVIIGTASSSS